MRSKNIVFPGAGEVVVREEPVPAAKDDEVLCRAERSFVSSGTETRCLRGVFDPGTNWESWVKYPFRPGYSMAGTVVEAGSAVRGVQPGDRVACRRPHGQYFTARAGDLAPIPDGVTFEAAAASLISVTAQQGVRRAEVVLGETAAVIGLGIIGQFVVRYLGLMGLRRIIAVDTREDRLAMAVTGGATHRVDAKASDLRGEIASLTEGRMADMVFEVTGNPEVLPAAIPLVRKLGRIILLGDATEPSRQRLGPGVVSNSIRIDGIHATASPDDYSVFHPWTYAEMVRLYFDFVAGGRMRVDPLITRRCRPEEAPAVYRELLAGGGELGVVFEWT